MANQILEKFKKMQQNQKQRFVKDTENIPQGVNFHWTIILYSLFLATLLSLGFDMYVLNQTNKEETLAPVEQVHAPKINEKKLQTIIDYFDKRAEDADSILKQKPTVVDPSGQ